MARKFVNILTGEDDDRIAAEKARKEALEAVWMRWSETDVAFTHAGHQACTSEIIVIQRSRTAELLIKAFPNLQEKPYKRVREIVDSISPAADIEGAVLFATLTREGHIGPETDTAVPFGELFQGLQAIHTDGSDELNAYLAAVGQLHLLQPLFICVVEFLSKNLVKQFKELDNPDGRLDEIVSGLVVDGIRLEFLVTRLIRDQRASEDIMQQVFERVADGEEISEEEAMVRLMGGIPTPGDALPWPLDHQCRCGADLKPFIFCCDSKKPIDPATFEADLHDRYLHKAPCCNQNFSGFNCDLCGRLYTWAKGVVGSVA